MNIGDRIFSIGVVTVLVSLAVYVVMCIDGCVRVILNMRLGTDAFALPLIGFMLGLVILAVGRGLGDFQRMRGTPYERRNRRRR